MVSLFTPFSQCQNAAFISIEYVFTFISQERIKSTIEVN
jgi:hypothetical protein